MSLKISRRQLPKCFRWLRAWFSIFGSRCVIHREALASRILSVAMKHKLAIIMQAVNFVRTRAVNVRSFAELCMDSNHETAVSYICSVVIGNVLTCVYEVELNWRYSLKLMGNGISCHSRQRGFSWRWRTLWTFSMHLII